MAEATATILIEARDRASAQIKNYGMALQDAGNKAQAAGVKTKQMGGSMSSALERIKNAQAPLRNLSAVLGGFGLSFLGITAATQALMGMMKQMLANNQAAIGMQLSMRRWGLTVDDASRLTKQFSAILGTTWATQMAGMDEETIKFLDTFGAEKEQIIRWAGDITKFGGIPMAETFKKVREEIKELGREQALKNLADDAALARKEASELRKTWEGFKDIWAPIGEAFLSALVFLFTPPKELTTPIKAALLSIPKWIKDNWEGMVIGQLIMPLPVVGALMGGFFQQYLFPSLFNIFKVGWTAITTFGVNIWSGFLGFWIKLGQNIISFAMDIWGKFGEWWSKLISGLADFWSGVWHGMKGIAISIYNWIMDRFTDAIAFANNAIAAINSALGLVGMNIPAISLRFAHAEVGVTPTYTAPTYTAPSVPAATAGTIIIPIQIGDKRLLEIVVDLLTGAVRQKELSE